MTEEQKFDFPKGGVKMTMTLAWVSFVSALIAAALAASILSRGIGAGVLDGELSWTLWLSVVSFFTGLISIAIQIIHSASRKVMALILAFIGIFIGAPILLFAVGFGAFLAPIVVGVFHAGL